MDILTAAEINKINLTNFTSETFINLNALKTSQYILKNINILKFNNFYTLNYGIYDEVQRKNIRILQQNLVKKTIIANMKYVDINERKLYMIVVLLLRREKKVVLKIYDKSNIQSALQSLVVSVDDIGINLQSDNLNTSLSESTKKLYNEISIKYINLHLKKDKAMKKFYIQKENEWENLDENF